MHIYILKIRGLWEQQPSDRFHLCVNQLSFSSRNWTSTFIRVMYHCSVQHRKKWDCKWHTNFGPGFGLRKSPIRRCPQVLHLPALLPVFHLRYFLISFIIFQYMQMLCLFPWVLYVMHSIRSSYTKYLQDWTYHAIILLCFFVESFSFLKINKFCFPLWDQFFLLLQSSI